MGSNRNQMEFIDYLLKKSKNGMKKLPPIAVIAKDLGLSIPMVREYLAVAKQLGLINIQPRTGISILPYDFSPAISTSLYYAVQSEYAYFEQYSDLRNQIEKAYFIPAAKQLLRNDIQGLLEIVDNALKQLQSNPIRIPHEEHKQFHLNIYKYLDNVFIDGILNTYWDMYELVGLNTYADFSYLEIVWKYHQDIAVAVADNKLSTAYTLLTDHIALLKSREDVQRSSGDATAKNK